MTTEDIRADIAAFADNEESVLVDKGLVVFQRDRETYECLLSESAPGQIDIEINHRKLPYFRFLAEVLGRLSVLAQSIQQKRKDVVPYIDAQATLLDSLGRPSHSGSAMSILQEKCGTRVMGETTLVFLTADAGEGKTALLRRLTQQSAKDYEVGKATSLLLHIDTQGRSFVRLEEAVARELGQLRVSGLFYSGVVRLIRRGLLTIAIDGFDELLAEIGSGEAYSGLGAFLKQLGGSGIVIAAARSAYFEAENYAAQTRLLSSMPDVQVTVEQMRLDKWQRRETVAFFTHFVDESSGARIHTPEDLYDELAGLVGPNHVILQRPFLVYTMAKMLCSTPHSAREIVRDIGESGLKVVPNVIRAFLKREVDEKWRDPNGQPYLALDQHIHLLAAVADEMWTQLENSLPTDLVQLVAETVIDELGIPLQRRVQIVERIKAHVLLPVSAGGASDRRAFDHDEFLYYFLAVRLCELLKLDSKANLRRFLERSSLPVMTAKWVPVVGEWPPEEIALRIAELNTLTRSEVRSTFLKQNAGLLASRLGGSAPNTPGLRFESMYFEGDTWIGTGISGAEYKRCIFNGVDLRGCRWADCQFIECQFQSLTIDQATQLQNCRFDEKSLVAGLLEADKSEDAMRIYRPDVCERILSERGARFEKPVRQLELTLGAVPKDVRTALNRFLRTFSRSSGANENVIKMRLGPLEHLFNKNILPALRHRGIVRQSEYRGSGSQERYELNYPVDVILSAEDPESTAPKDLIQFWNELRKS